MQLEPDHPALIQGRRHSRDVLESAARVVRVSGETKTADAMSTLSTALQLVATAALVDGFDPQEVYGASAAFLAWLIARLPPQDHVGVLAAMTNEVVNRVQLAEAAEAPMRH